MIAWEASLDRRRQRLAHSLAAVVSSEACGRAPRRTGTARRSPAATLSQFPGAVHCLGVECRLPISAELSSEVAIALRVADGCDDDLGLLDADDAMSLWLRSCTDTSHVDPLTREVVEAARKGVPALVASYEAHRASPTATNGALLRNSIAVASAETLPHAFMLSLLQGISTHYHPLSVMCCAAQAWLIQEYFTGRDPFDRGDWRMHWHRDWLWWAIVAQANPVVKEWTARVESDNSLDDATSQLCSADFDPDTFDPFAGEVESSCPLRSLQLCVWLMHWAKHRPKEFPYRVPRRLRAAAPLFQKRRHAVLSWLRLLPGDVRLHAAIAAPMLVAALGRPFRKRMSKTRGFAHK